MRIISDFKDYYDFLSDPSDTYHIWNRKTEIITIHKNDPDFTKIFFLNNFQTYPVRRRHSEEKFADNTICRHVIPPDRKFWEASQTGRLASDPESWR